MKKLNLTIFLLSFFTSIFAQPINDDCPGIIDLGTAPICPVIDTFTNVNATASVVFSDPSANIPLCFNSGNVERDVWFQFTAPLDISDFTVTVSGVDWMNGAIVQPQIAVYRGDCLLDELVELGCATSNANANEISIDLMGLTPNITYFLRINDWTSSATPNWGDFVLCVAEFVPDYIMGEDTETTACSGTLFDSGGPDGDYQVNENFTFTICPNELTGCINLDLVSYNLENNFDFLNIFAGDGLDGPQMTNLSGSGMSVPLMAGDNCVTIQFTSDISIVNEGFELTWQCEAEDCNTTLIPCLQTQTIFWTTFYF